MILDYEYLQRLTREGELLEAMRVCLAFLRENIVDGLALYELSRLCLQLGDRKTACEGFRAAARDYAENGNLPMAIVCLRELELAGENAEEVTKLLASIFGKGSKRVKDMAMPVPPLPSVIQKCDPRDLRLDKDFLLKEAAKFVTLADESSKMALKMRQEAPPVPYFPLFGALSEQDFIDLVATFSPRKFFKDEVLITQGEIATTLLLIARGEVSVFIAEKAKNESGLKQQVSFKNLATLGPGAFVGEMGIVARTPRSATVKAVASGILLSAPLGAIEELAGRVPELAEIIVAFCEARLLENVMAISPILVPLKPEQRPEALQMFDRLYFPAGNVILTEGSEARGIYVVVSGVAAVTTSGKAPTHQLESFSTGRRIFITTLSGGDIFGEISTVLRKPTNATVHTISDTALLFLPKERFLAFTKRFPEAFQRIYEIITMREAEMERILASHTSSPEEVLRK